MSSVHVGDISKTISSPFDRFFSLLPGSKKFCTNHPRYVIHKLDHHYSTVWNKFVIKLTTSQCNLAMCKTLFGSKHSIKAVAVH